MHSAVFVEHVISAFSLKLVSSLDDVIWLASFFTPEKSRRDDVGVCARFVRRVAAKREIINSRPQRLWNAATYAAICTLQAVLAWTIAVFGESGTALLMRRTGLTSVSPDQVLTLGERRRRNYTSDRRRRRARAVPKGTHTRGVIQSGRERVREREREIADTPTPAHTLKKIREKEREREREREERVLRAVRTHTQAPGSQWRCTPVCFSETSCALARAGRQRARASWRSTSSAEEPRLF